MSANCQTIGYLERGDYRPSLELAFRLAPDPGEPASRTEEGARDALLAATLVALG